MPAKTAHASPASSPQMNSESHDPCGFPVESPKRCYDTQKMCQAVPLGLLHPRGAARGARGLCRSFHKSARLDSKPLRHRRFPNAATGLGSAPELARGQMSRTWSAAVFSSRSQADGVSLGAVHSEMTRAGFRFRRPRSPHPCQEASHTSVLGLGREEARSAFPRLRRVS